mgnify:CR=1 FL=1
MLQLRVRMAGLATALVLGLAAYVTVLGVGRRVEPRPRRTAILAASVRFWASSLARMNASMPLRAQVVSFVFGSSGRAGFTYAQC